MSQNGLVTDCHAGIKPQVGEVLAVQMQANGYAGIRESARPIVFGYALSRYRNVVQSRSGEEPVYKSEPGDGSSVQDSPCNFIWWTKNRCLGNQDARFPGANTSGCIGIHPGFLECPSYIENDGGRWDGCNTPNARGGGLDIAWDFLYNYTEGNNPAEPQSMLCDPKNPDLGDWPRQFKFPDCESPDTCCSLIWVSNGNLAAESDENGVGSYISELWDYTSAKRKFTFNPIYPSATKDEIKSSFYKNSIGCPHNNTDLKLDSVIKGCGLTPYQERVSEHLNPDIWEILQFNDKKPVVVLHREIESDPEFQDTGLDIVGTIGGTQISLSVDSGAKDIAAGPDFLVALAVMKDYECVDSEENIIQSSDATETFSYCYKKAGFGSDVLISFPDTWLQGKGITALSGLFRAWTDSDSFPYYNQKKIKRGLSTGCSDYESGAFPEFTPRAEGEMFGYENRATMTPEWSPPVKLSAGGERCIITRKNGATVTSTGYPVGGWIFEPCVGWNPQWENSVAASLLGDRPTNGQFCSLGPHTETILFDRSKDHMGSATVPYSPVSAGISFNWVCPSQCASCKLAWIGPFSEPISAGASGCPCLLPNCSEYYQSYFSCNGIAIDTETSIPSGGFKQCSSVLGGRTGTFVENVLWIKDNGQYDILSTGTDLCKGVQSWKQISCGMHHNVAINNYGISGGSNVFCWGASYANQTDFNPTAINLAKKVSAGYYHSLALRNNGTIWAWGGGGTFNKGQSDIGQFSNTNFIDIAAGKFHSCAIKQDGTVVCWGAGTSGASGAEDFKQSVPPIQLTDKNHQDFIKSTSIACGAYHSCAILGDGGLTCWGNSNNGRFDFNTESKKYTKVVCGEKFSAAKWKPKGFYRSYPIVLPHTNEIIETGNWPHNLFKYFFTFVSQQFSYAMGQMDCLEDGSYPSDILMNRSMPGFFHQISDAVHLFSFEFDTDEDGQKCLKAICEQSNWDEGYEYGYNKQQLMPQDSIEAVFQAHSDSKWEQNVDDANAILGAKFKDRLQLKDWRGEIWNDIKTLVQDSTTSIVALPLLLKYDNPSKIKCVGPARLRGDMWEIRAAAADTNATNNPFKPFEADLTKRPPELAKMATPKPGSSWPDCYRDPENNNEYTLQVNADIYGLQLPQGVNVAQLPQNVQAAFYRLTNTIYFRSRSILPNWEWSPRDFEARSPWPNEEDLTHWSRRKHRYAWLQKAGRTISPYPNKSPVDRYNVVQSLGTNLGGSPSAINQSYWSISGQGHAVQPVIDKGTVPDEVCDTTWGAKMAHLGNSCSFIGRYIPPLASESYIHSSKQSPKFFINNGSAYPASLFPGTQYGSGRTVIINQIPHPESVNESSLTSNICFGRFVGRDYTWDNSQVPYSLKFVEDPKQHPVDSHSVCSEIPQPKMHPQFLGRPFNTTGIDFANFKDGAAVGPWFQQYSGSIENLCKGIKPAEGIMEWDGPGRRHAGDSGPIVLPGWFNNFVYDPETGIRNDASGCTLIWDEECCKALNNQAGNNPCCDPNEWNNPQAKCTTCFGDPEGCTNNPNPGCGNLNPGQGMFGELTPCDCASCTQRLTCVKQIKCDSWSGPTYDLYEPAIGASFSGGHTGNSCCFVTESRPSRWEEGNPIYEEWRSGAFLTLPPIRPTPTDPDGCQNREKASCCYWKEYQPGEFTVSGKHFHTYRPATQPEVESNMCNSFWGTDPIDWQSALGLGTGGLGLMSPETTFRGLVRGRMMCLENQIDPEWQHYPEVIGDENRACVPKGITIGTSGPFSYFDYRLQANECDAGLVVKLNKMIRGLTTEDLEYKFTRCYNLSEINSQTSLGGCTSSYWPAGLPTPPGWTNVECGQTGCCYCFGVFVDVENNDNTSFVEDWSPYGSFENYCKGALNGNYRPQTGCPRGKGQEIIKQAIDAKEFSEKVNAYEYNCNAIQNFTPFGPGTSKIPIQCLNCVSRDSNELELGKCLSGVSSVSGWTYDLVKFDPVGYFALENGGYTLAGKDGYCRAPMHIWVNVFDGRGTNRSVVNSSPVDVNSLDMVYAGPCWPHPDLWQNAPGTSGGKISLSDGLTWQPCQRGKYSYDKDTSQWKHVPGIVDTEPCQADLSSNNGVNCCDDPDDWFPTTEITYILPGGGETTETPDGNWTKPVLATEPFASAFVAAGKCINEDATPTQCWVCPTSTFFREMTLPPCLLEGDVQGQPTCNCNPDDTKQFIQDGITLEWCKCDVPIGCPSDLSCESKVCEYDRSCCENKWTIECSNIAINMCQCSQYQCPCECRNYEALKWSADQYNHEGWTGGKTIGLDLLINPQDCEGITCDDCRKCDLPLCIHKYNCNLKCPCGTYGMNCEKTCQDSTGFYGEYDEEFLGKGTIIWKNNNTQSDGGGGGGGMGGGS